MSTLSVSGLTLRAPDGQLILDDVGFDVPSGHVVGLVGESGSGKSMTSLALAGLLPEAITPVSGIAQIDGRTFMTDGRVASRPGISIVFQNARAALNPTMRIGAQFARLLSQLETLKRADLDRRVEQLLTSVGIAEPARVRRSYPHQLSGGMNQRVMIAMALASRPGILIADEPTTGLDVTVQAQILQLLRMTTEESDRGVLLITHDLGVVAQMCTTVVVMYRGQIKEIAPVDDIFHHPADPYTRELVASVAPDALSPARAETIS